MANTNGLYISSTEYMFKDLTKPDVILAANTALNGDGTFSHVVLNLNGTRANLGSYLASLSSPSQANNNSFDAYAAANPAAVPSGSSVYNPANPSQPLPDNDAYGIDATKTVAIAGIFNDIYVKVYMSNVTPSSIISVTLADGTVLPYNPTNGDYEKEISTLVPCQLQ